MDNQGVAQGPQLGLKYAGDGIRIECISSKSVHGFRRQSDNIPTGKQSNGLPKPLTCFQNSGFHKGGSAGA